MMLTTLAYAWEPALVMANEDNPSIQAEITSKGAIIEQTEASIVSESKNQTTTNSLEGSSPAIDESTIEKSGEKTAGNDASQGSNAIGAFGGVAAG